MKKKIVFIIILCSVFFTMKVGITQDNIPPYNKALFALHPDTKFAFPQVPRITAEEALCHYEAGSAFFLGGGHANSAVPGGLYFAPGSGKYISRYIDIERLKAAFLPNNKLLIVYWAWNDDHYSARMVLQWMKEGKIKNVRVVLAGRKEMIKAGFEFISYEEWEKWTYKSSVTGSEDLKACLDGAGA